MDSNDPERFEEAKKELLIILKEVAKDVPMLVFFNKQVIENIKISIMIIYPFPIA